MAKWINKDNEVDWNKCLIFTCSECGEQSISDCLCTYGAFLTPYCPWCGAEMDDWYETQAYADAQGQIAREERRNEIEREMAKH